MRFAPRAPPSHTLVCSLRRSSAATSRSRSPCTARSSHRATAFSVYTAALRAQARPRPKSRAACWSAADVLCLPDIITRRRLYSYLVFFLSFPLRAPKTGFARQARPDLCTASREGIVLHRHDWLSAESASHALLRLFVRLVGLPALDGQSEHQPATGSQRERMVHAGHTHRWTNFQGAFLRR